MKISIIMIGGMAVLFLIFAIFGLVTFDLSIQEMKKLLSSRNEAAAFNMMQNLDQKLENRISDLRTLTKLPQVQTALKDSNEKFSQLSDIKNYIATKEQEIEFEGQTEFPPFMTEVINQKLTIEFRDTIEFYRDEYNFDVFKELFVTNAYGANVALGSGISDYTQDDEQWWQTAKDAGIFYDELRFWDDYNTTGIAFAYRVDDENSNFIGVMRVLVSLEDILSDFVDEAEIVNNQNRNVILVNGQGNIIFSNEIHVDENSISVPYIEKIVDEKDFGTITLEDEVEDIRLISYAKSTGYRFFEGFDWVVLVDQDNSSIVEEFIDLRNSIIAISIIGIFISIIIGLVISKLVTNPLKHLSKMAKSISKGDFDIHPKSSQINELDTIGKSFSKMADSLEKLIETEKKLVEANARVKNERFTAIGELAASVAHNMKNPLGTIQSSADIVKRSSKGKDEELDKVLTRMNRAISTISNQIEGVLNYVRTTPVTLTKVSINSILDHSKESLEISENIKLKFPEKSLDITCDEKKMEIVFINLILNAIQAIGKEKGTITIRAKEEGEYVYVEFEDTGSGIPEYILPKIFEALVTTKEKGTGLGLSSCKNIIEQHGGTISAQNNPTRFTIKLPKNPKLRQF